MAIIYFRNQIGQTGQAIGSGLSGLAQGISDIGGGVGSGFASALGGVGAGIAGLASPFGLTLPYQQQNYRPYVLNLYQNQPGNLGGSGSTSSGQDQVVTPHTREFSDMAAQLQSLVASGRDLNATTMNALAQITAENPSMGHAQRAQMAIQASGGISPYEVFTTTAQLARESGMSAGDAFMVAKGTLTGAPPFHATSAITSSMSYASPNKAAPVNSGVQKFLALQSSYL